VYVYGQDSAVAWRHFLYSAPLEMDDSLQLADGGSSKNVSWIHITLFLEIREQMDSCGDMEQLAERLTVVFLSRRVSKLQDIKLS